MSSGNPEGSRKRPPNPLIWVVAGLALIVVVLAIALRPGPTAGTPPVPAAPPGGSGTATVGENAPAHLNGLEPTPGTTAAAPARNAPPAAPTASKQDPAAAPPAPDPHADLPSDHPPLAEADPATQVTIQWLGHSCFYIHSPGGTAVVLDPFDPAATGLPSPDTGAHLVALTSSRPEHGFAGAIRAFEGETKTVVRGTPARRGDLQLTPVPIDPGTVAYVVDAGGMRIAHLGGLRRPLLPGQVKALGAVDVLLLPAGDELKPADAVAVAKALNPRVIIPMAYSTPDMTGPAARLRPVDAFVAASPYARERKDADVVLISKAGLPPSTEIWELRYHAR